MNASLEQALEHFLNQPDIIELMRENSDNDRPAVEGLGDILLEIKEDQTKQDIGRMVRRVLENNGYDWESEDHPVKDKLFKKGSRYRRREE